MNIYGNDTEGNDKGEALSFRIWDASKGVAYVDVQLAVGGEPVSVIFEQDKMIGNFDHPVIWTKTNAVEQLIPVHENWNWIAFGVKPKSTSLGDIFSQYADWQLLIKNRDAFSDYNGTEWNGSLTPQAGEMYKLKVDRRSGTAGDPARQLSLLGEQPSPGEMPVSLQKGWNWIAYTPLVTMPVAEALAGANPQKGDIVKSQTGVAIYGNYGWEGSLQALESGNGYMYYSIDDAAKSFVYPTTTSVASARMALQHRDGDSQLSVFTPVDRFPYPNNMTMVIQLRDGSAVIDTCEVAAFVGDECRGATRASSNGLYYLVIAGEGSGQSMSLRTCLEGEVVTIDETLQFVSDNNIGTSWQPYVIDLNSVTSISEISNPDSDDNADWWTLQGFKVGKRPTTPGVYIHRGEIVVIKAKR